MLLKADFFVCVFLSMGGVVKWVVFPLKVCHDFCIGFIIIIQENCLYRYDRQVPSHYMTSLEVYEIRVNGITDVGLFDFT